MRAAYLPASSEREKERERQTPGEYVDMTLAARGTPDSTMLSSPPMPAFTMNRSSAT